MRHRRRMHLARHQPGKVRHVDQEIRAHLIRNLPHPRKIEHPRIRTAPADDHLRLLAHRLLLKRVVVDRLRILPHLVPGDLVQLSRKIQLVPMRQMPAIREVQPQDRIARAQQRHVRRRIGLRPRMRLHVDMIGPKQPLRPVPRQVLDDVRKLAPTVVPLARIPFGILVRKHRTRGLEHRPADKVLRRNHLQPLVLTSDFLLKLPRDLRIGDTQTSGKVNRHPTILCHTPAPRLIHQRQRPCSCARSNTRSSAGPEAISKVSELRRAHIVTRDPNGLASVLPAHWPVLVR